MVSRRQLAAYIASQLVSSKSNKTVMRQLAAYIVTHSLQKQTNMIIGDIEAELATHGSVAATVVSAHPLTGELRQSLEAYVVSQTKASTVMLKELVDPSIIGGVIIKTPDKTLDISVTSRLKKLKTT